MDIKGYEQCHHEYGFQNGRCRNPYCGASAKTLARQNRELKQQVEALTEALTPSGETKAAYHGETEAGWTTTKDIMRLIRERATSQQEKM